MKKLNKLGTMLLTGIRILYLLARMIVMVPFILIDIISGGGPFEKETKISPILDWYCRVSDKPDGWLEKQTKTWGEK